MTGTEQGYTQVARMQWIAIDVDIHPIGSEIGKVGSSERRTIAVVVATTDCSHSIAADFGYGYRHCSHRLHYSLTAVVDYCWI